MLPQSKLSHDQTPQAQAASGAWAAARESFVESRHPCPPVINSITSMLSRNAIRSDTMTPIAARAAHHEESPCLPLLGLAARSAVSLLARS